MGRTKNTNEQTAEIAEVAEQEPKAVEEQEAEAEAVVETETVNKEAEVQKDDPVRLWRAKMNCQMPWRDFEKNETVKLKDSQVTPRVRILFECISNKEQKKVDPEIAIMAARLKAAKIPMKRNMPDVAIRELFNKFLGDGVTASEIAKEVE